MIETFGVTFKSLRRLLRLLGYNSVMSINSVKKNYGSIDQLVAKRLQTNDANKIQSILLELKQRENGHTANFDLTVSTNIDNVCLAVLRAIYMQCDETLRNTVIATIASVNNINANELKQKINQTLK